MTLTPTADLARYDIVVIGAGIAGTSVASFLSQHASVRLLEMESQPGYHSTGRSAALFAEPYGNAVVRSLTRASRAFFEAPPAGLTSVDLLNPRPVLITARSEQVAAMEEFIASSEASDCVVPQTAAEAMSICPILRSESVARAALIGSPSDIDVHELQQGFLKIFKTHGGGVTTAAQVVGIERDSSGWIVTTTRERIRASIVVNAAGAWAGEIGKLAGAQDIGLRPLKRTACLVAPPEGARLDTWPLVMNVAEEFYFKPEAGMLMLSPADETLPEPCDAQAEELDIAIAVDRLERATTLQVRHIAHKWAGLRSFVADRSPVVGFDALQPDFFWIAALGGYGVQTSPAVGSVAASLILREAIDEKVLACGVEERSFAPDRLLR
jgi:D-arginine dehydrogenase